MARAKFTNWFKRRWQTLGLLPQYLRVIIQQWNDILWLSIPAFPFVIWWFLGNPPVQVVAIVFVWVLIVAGYYAWRSEHVRLMPKLEFSPQVFLEPTGTRAGEWMMYLQVLPRCLTESPVEQCRGRLLRVLVKQGEDWKPTGLNEPLDLVWSYHDSSSCTLHPRVDQRLNIAWAGNKIGIVLGVEPTQNPIKARWVFTANDVFRFDVALTAKDCPSISISVQASITERRTDGKPPAMAASVLTL